MFGGFHYSFSDVNRNNLLILSSILQLTVAFSENCSYNEWVMVMVFKATFNNITIISWRLFFDGGNRSSRKLIGKKI